MHSKQVGTLNREESAFSMKPDNSNPASEPSPNHALQRTAPRVTVAAISSLDPSRPSVALSYVRCLLLRSTTQLPRRAPQSLSLGSLGVATRVLFNEDLLPVFSEAMPIPALPSLFPSTRRAIRVRCRRRVARVRRVHAKPQRLTRRCRRTAPRVTGAALHVRSRLVRAGRCLTSVASFFAPPSQLPRRAPQSLSLGSLGVSSRVLHRSI